MRRQERFLEHGGTHERHPFIQSINQPLSASRGRIRHLPQITGISLQGMPGIPCNRDTPPSATAQGGGPQQSTPPCSAARAHKCYLRPERAPRWRPAGSSPTAGPSAGARREGRAVVARTRCGPGELRACLVGVRRAPRRRPGPRRGRAEGRERSFACSVGWSCPRFAPATVVADEGGSAPTRGCAVMGRHCSGLEVAPGCGRCRSRV